MALYLRDSHSLKNKRGVLSSLKARVHQRFNVSIAELEGQERWQMATLGLCFVSSNLGHAREVLSEAVRFIERETVGQAEVLDCQTELLEGLS